MPGDDVEKAHKQHLLTGRVGAASTSEWNATNAASSNAWQV